MATVLLFLVLLNSFFVAQSVIHPSQSSKKGLVEPFVMEANPEEDLQNEFKGVKSHHSSRYTKSIPAQTTPPGFGTTVPLTGDNHNFGLVHWSGLPKERIFIMTSRRQGGHSSDSYLWMSKDYGKSFQNVTNKFPSDAVLEWYRISSNADKLVFTDIINNRVYVTLDEGDNFTSYNVDFVPDTLVFQKSWVPNVVQYEDHILGYYEDKKELWVSIDTGSTWTKLGSSVTRFAWRELNDTYEDPSTVYFDISINDTAALLYKATYKNGSYVKELFDPSLGPFSPSSFVLSHQYMFVQKNYTLLGVSTMDSPLLVSHKRGMFQPANFPLDIEERHYALVDASENQVLVAVYHNPNDTHLYLSEEAGMNYTLSLNNIISPPEDEWIDSYPTFDVYVVESLLGTYIANRKIPSSSHGNTVISFDKGGEWHTIPAPAVNRNGKPIACNPPCSLHLHMFVDSSYFIQPILSQESAPGIIMAIGNIGTSIVTQKSKLRLYMSDNGGVTWREVDKGYKQFRLLNYGVFTVMVDKGKSIYYTDVSCNEGADWSTYNFTDITTPIRVVAMYTERGEKAQHVTIFGYYIFQSFNWLVIDLDFTTFNLAQCNKTTDYYLWKPTDERPDQDCILGETIEYERRLPDKCCYIEVEYDRPINRTVCDCTDEDFECEVNFERVGFSGECTPVDGYDYPPDPPDVCPEMGNYTYTSGYRKIAGDKCVLGEETFFLPVIEDCPIDAPGALDLIVTDKEYTKVVNELFNFELTQGQGGVLSTTYEWSFGDNTTELYTGFDDASTTSHTYTHPGSYKVELTAINAGGQGVDDLAVSVSDVITKVEIVMPTFVFVEAPANFNARLTTDNGTDFLFNVKYQWTTDGKSVTKTTSYFSTMFTSPGEHQLDIDVSYVGGVVKNHATIVVMNPTYGLQVAAYVNNQSVSKYIPVNQTVTFRTTFLDNKVFPEGTSFHWLILFGSDGSHLYDKNITSNSITLPLPRWDNYTVSVISHNEEGVAYGSGVYWAEEIISGVSFNMNPMYRINQFMKLPIQLTAKNFDHFTGTFEVTVWQGGVNTGSEISSGSNEYLLNGDGSDQDGIKVSFILVESGTYNVTLQVKNNISQVIESRRISVADYSNFEYFRLFFETTKVNNSHDWLTALQNDITNVLSQRFSLEAWQLVVNVTEEVDPNQNRRRKRQGDAPEVIAHISLLPYSLKAEDISLVYNISRDIIDQTNDGRLSFTVNGQTVAATKADMGPSIIIIDTGDTIEKKSYLVLAVSLGVGGLILMVAAITIIIGAIIYYRKKYRKLEVRYSRLRQGPMRFTFTAEGENIEEEDWNEEDSNEIRGGGINDGDDYDDYDDDDKELSQKL